MTKAKWRNEAIEIGSGYRLIAGKVRKERAIIPVSDGPLLVQDVVALLNDNTEYNLQMKTPEQIEDVRHRGYRAGYEEGYDNGVADLKDRELRQDESVIDPEERRFIEHQAKKEALVEHAKCHRCRFQSPDSLHHIIPTRSGGSDILDNQIPLCDRCHNEVEAYTDELVENGKVPSRGMMREYIETSFPNE